MEFPDAPYLHREDEPQAGPNRPLSQGDVFIDVPLVGAAIPDPKQAGVWRSTKPRTGPKALGLFVTHPCASRSSATHALRPVIALAPVVLCPSDWGPPWTGHYDLFPLPGLLGGRDYVAKLNEVCPVQSAALVGRRIACLTRAGLQALFNRLAMNALRFPETPLHYRTEATRLTYEMDLWERWIAAKGYEEGYQQWLDGPFGGQPAEDAEGQVVEGSERPTGQSRRSVLTWNFEEVSLELDEELGI